MVILRSVRDPQHWFMALGFNKFESIAQFLYNFRTTRLSCIARAFNDVTLADIQTIASLFSAE